MKTIVQFSGGKDSTALLYLLRPRLNEMTVVFGDTGAVFPHVRRFVEDTCKALGAELCIISPRIGVREFTEQVGLPSDMVPVELSPEMAPFMTDKPTIKIQSYLSCCAEMIFQPMMEYIRVNDIKTVYRGSKKSDARVGVGPSHLENGVLYESPLWDWTDADVFEFLAKNDVTLPDHYRVINDSLDCWLCTAHLIRGGKEKMAYIRERYPDLWPEVTERMTLVRNAISAELKKISPPFEEATRHV